MYNNKILELLFSKNGRVTRRQYWGGLCLLLLGILAAVVFERSWWMLDTIYQVRITPHSHMLPNIAPLITSALLLLIPYMGLVVYSSFVITLKRARTRYPSISFGWLLGACTSLMYISLLIGIYACMYYQSNINETLFYYNFRFIILQVCSILLGIISVIYLSSKGQGDGTNSKNGQYDSIRCIFDLILLIVGYIFILYIINTLIPEDSTIYLTSIFFLLIVSIIVLGRFVKIMIMRAYDADVSMSKVWILFIISAIMLVFYTVICPGIFSGYDNPLIMFIFETVLIVFLNIIIFLSFILIIKPSRESIN